MFFSTLATALIGASLTNAHMIMSTPVPYGKSSLTNSPLVNVAGSSDFPCKQRSGVYDAEGASNSMALGSTQPLSFTGSAVHGGGSCQISITYDQAPTASSTFKVITSIIGGCPAQDQTGNLPADNAAAADPYTYNFTIPDNIPTGTATLAWTWFNKIGNREMYMNCAPVTLTAASSKRSDDDELLSRNVTQLMERDQAAYDALPNMFVANAGVNSCATQDSKDLVFPNPGDSVQSLGGSTAASATAGPTGTCDTASAAASGSGTSPATSAATSTYAPAPSSSAAASSSGLPGGVFATVPVSGSSATSTAAVSSATSVAATSVGTGTTPVSTGTSGSGSAIAAGTACTDEGEWNCIDDSSFQRCASGAWSVVQQLAAGTSCTSGQSSVINMVTKPKRAVRFSNEHVRRHLLRAS